MPWRILTSYVILLIFELSYFTNIAVFREFGKFFVQQKVLFLKYNKSGMAAGVSAVLPLDGEEKNVGVGCYQPVGNASRRPGLTAPAGTIS